MTIPHSYSELKKKLRFYWHQKPFSVSYSQCGEDLLLKSFLIDKWRWDYEGFWVDIGAHHPTALSNTKIFSDIGWHGINVDASIDAISIFNRERTRDTNINVGIGLHPGMLDYYKMSLPPMNTFSKEFAERMVAENDDVKILEVIHVPVVTMEQLLDKHLPHGQSIDFLSIDCEGLDIEILQSNNFQKYRPEFILIEIHTNAKNWEIQNSPAAQFLDAHGYKLVAQSRITSLFRTGTPK